MYLAQDAAHLEAMYISGQAEHDLDTLEISIKNFC
jgi:hypothetical protein